MCYSLAITLLLALLNGDAKGSFLLVASLCKSVPSGRANNASRPTRVLWWPTATMILWLSSGTRRRPGRYQLTATMVRLPAAALIIWVSWWKYRLSQMRDSTWYTGMMMRMRLPWCAGSIWTATPHGSLRPFWRAMPPTIYGWYASLRWPVL